MAETIVTLAYVGILLLMFFIMFLILNAFGSETIQCLDFSKPMYQHIHVLVQGLKIPANVGILPTGCIKEIHTHHPNGILHLESTEPKNFTLSQFFDVWENQLNPNFNWTVTINGKPATLETPLADQDRIHIGVKR